MGVSTETRGAWAPKGRSPKQLHLELNALHRERLSPGVPTDDWRERLLLNAERALLEGRFLEEERLRVASRARTAPREAHAFAAWFDALREHGPGQFDPLFDYLAEEATREEVTWFLRQEVAGEGRRESATQAIAAEAGIPVVAVATLGDLLAFADQSAELADERPRLQAYRAQYGVGDIH